MSTQTPPQQPPGVSAASAQAIPPPGVRPGLLRIALAVGIAGLVLGASAFAYVVFIASPPVMPSTIFSQTVYAIDKDMAGGYFDGYQASINFTVPGPSGSLAVVNVSVTIGSSGCGNLPRNDCVIYFLKPTPTANTFFIPYLPYIYINANATVQSTYILTATLPAGTVEIFAVNYAIQNCNSSGCTYSANPFSFAATVVWEGTVSLR